ncbi:hypothetical protein B0O99DRAFT_678522 [Bisporella sp. PMI_857]|nr:hypothetical protein B0O99DRAFT_678522 [Bisporella sp. PMI_857]
MSPTVIADIEKRSLRDPWDRLAIAANCCQYQIRLSTGRLLQKAQSRSLSMLTMCLLNGEILHNSATYRAVSWMTISRYLKAQLFNEFYAPKDKRSLTFNKGCRFIDVELRAGGIVTKGHLWKLGRIIRTATFPHSVDNGGEKFWGLTFPKRYLRTMIVELVTAMDEGKILRLGSIMGPMEALTPYTAIFIWEGDDHEVGEIEGSWDEKSEDMRSQDNASDKSDRRQTALPAFVFTASCPKKTSSGQYDINDLDRHVSLEVECAGLTKQVISNVLLIVHIAPSIEHDLVVPLVSGGQNFFSLVLGSFPKEYAQYLHEGSQSEQLAFAKVEKYGIFKMQDSDELGIVFTIIVALSLKLQSIGPVG